MLASTNNTGNLHYKTISQDLECSSMFYLSKINCIEFNITHPIDVDFKMA